MKKILLSLLSVLIMPGFQKSHATAIEVIKETATVIKENPIESTIGTILLINLCKSKEHSIIAYSLKYGFKAARATCRIAPEIFSTKALVCTVATAAIGTGAYFAYSKFKNNDDEFGGF